MAVFQLKEEQIIHSSLDQVWSFISDPANLARITPDYMGFEVQSSIPPGVMYAGMIIQYKVKPILRIPMTWVTEITHVEEHKCFIDVQRTGPYRLWHHQHILTEIPEGVRMNDIVTYQPPLGFLGSLANHLFIRKQLDDIFNYRKVALDKIFSDSQTLPYL